MSPAPRQTIKDCPDRPPCPLCGMSMLKIKRIETGNDSEQCLFECLRCGRP